MKFDVVMLGDFRFPGGTSTAMAHELAVLSRAGYRVGLLQVNAALLNGSNRPLNPQLVAAIEAGQAVLVDPAEAEVEAPLAVLHNPSVFKELAGDLPHVSARHRILVCHQPALDSEGSPYYDPQRVHRVCESLVGHGVVWAPTSPILRANLEAAKLPFPLLDDDWANIIDVDDWLVERPGPLSDRPVIGRHSRPEWEKWPATRRELLTVYPDDPTVEVRMLGVGPYLRAQAEPMPANWTVFGFNEIPVPDFLRSIEFFVYYHHPKWVEGFGRNIAEAIASGAVAILPPYLRATFGEAALYREPQEVLATVREYHADREAYGLQARLGRMTIARRFGPRRYLDRIERLIGPAAGAAAPPPAAAPAADPDIVIVSDFRRHGDTAWRLAEEIRTQAAAGYRTTLLHLPSRQVDEPAIHPAIDACMRDGLAHAVDPAEAWIRARLLIIAAPQVTLDELPARLPHVGSERVLVIADEQPGPGFDPRERHRVYQQLFGAKVTWQATTAAIREALGRQVPVDEALWTPSVAARPPRPARPARERPVVGRASVADASQWAADEQTIASIYPADGRFAVRVLGVPRSGRFAGAGLAGAWEKFDIGEIDLSRFIGGLDAFAYYPGESPGELPLCAIALALAMGVPVLLPPELWRTVGDGPTYLPPAEAAEHVARLCRDPAAYAKACEAARAAGEQRFGASVHEGRIGRLLGFRPRPARGPVRRRVLFVSWNGIGLGHLTRQIAVARRLPAPAEPVFATMNAAMRVVAEQGFPAEFLAAEPFSEADPEIANAWLRHDLDEIIDFHNPAAVVFDGNVAHPGLLQAVAPRPGIRLFWMRRGLWRAGQANDALLRATPCFDRVIEPEDLAQELDRGLTAGQRSAVTRVPPIRLLDREELLPRPLARARLGLAPEQPAVLLLLGGGETSETAALTDAVLAAVRRFPGLQAVRVDSPLAGNGIDLWPEVAALRAFPVSRYFNAFDFAVSAAGYNSFHELMSLGLPAIFIPNDHPSTDDQSARATFAEANGAALALSRGELEQLGPMIGAMLDDTTRSVLRVNALRLARENGAAAAAQAICEGLLT